jgi:hypothetical protein
MTQLFDIDFAPIITSAALLGFIAVYFGRLRSRLRHRTSQLKTSSEITFAHCKRLLNIQKPRPR